MHFRVKEHKMIRVVDDAQIGHDDLSDAINLYISNGWEVYGDAIYRPETSNKHACFYQALVKYHDPFDKRVGEM